MQIHERTSKGRVSLRMQDHPFFMGVQYHPEYKSRPGQCRAHTLGLQFLSSPEIRMRRFQGRRLLSSALWLLQATQRR